jgi:hypothetical protein
MLSFIVTQAFGDYAKGDRIADPKAIQAVIDAGQEGYVVRVVTLEPSPGQSGAPAQDLAD